jgi:hypothetical protein
VIEIISQKYIEFLSSFVALFGENKCAFICLLITDITKNIVILDPLSFGKAAIAAI